MSRKVNWKRKYQRTYLRGFWCKFDRYAASHRAVREMKADGLLPEETNVQTLKYLNNLIEQGH